MLRYYDVPELTIYQVVVYSKDKESIVFLQTLWQIYPYTFLGYEKTNKGAIFVSAVLVPSF